MQAALRYQQSTNRRPRSGADAMDWHITKQDNGDYDDDDGSSGVLVPVALWQANGTQDRITQKPGSGPMS